MANNPHESPPSWRWTLMVKLGAWQCRMVAACSLIILLTSQGMLSYRSTTFSPSAHSTDKPSGYQKHKMICASLEEDHTNLSTWQLCHKFHFIRKMHLWEGVSSRYSIGCQPSTRGSCLQSSFEKVRLYSKGSNCYTVAPVKSTEIHSRRTQTTENLEKNKGSSWRVILSYIMVGQVFTIQCVCV